MNIKAYMKYLAATFPADSEDPTVIVQQLAVLAAINLAAKGRLPGAIGRGEDIDLDVVHAGIVAGLEKIKQYDGTIGTMRAFLYKTIAGTIQNYAWKRENRVTDGSWDNVLTLDSTPSAPADDTVAEDEVIVEGNDAEAIMLSEEREEAHAEGLRLAFAHLGEEGGEMLLKDSQIGYNAAARREWAESLGISIGALNMRLVRLRHQAREWALTLQ